ncbi:hypothetical protein C8J27_101428 [Rhodobacter aestuarii]|uniref:Uncharacterized protein n=1 Tax=Rhodobacter aestuarii TaxID=453582 RepID=A0A1N7J0H2_9RHOB|nr:MULTISPECIES: hypothetical protein [Rhodobacter]PTV97316.1 hypothetical protein C8J27_101428 [Rhodobacter aestuarii]SIS42853.1 hypothetical protein SAMN05421580_101214 [Rhodobacter aestuarii]SOB99742.1 hypothetical protein SAMN05877809_102496 [Rhodobacter sp. JA431]
MQDDDYREYGGLGVMQEDTAKRQNVKDAERKGRERREGYQNGKGGMPSDDGYGHMSPEEKAAYKKGYRGD